MRLRVLVAALLVVVVLLGVPVAAFAAGCDATVNGTLTGTDGPIAGATVVVDYLAKSGGLPKRTATIQTAADGTWTYTGKAGDNRFAFSADGFYSYMEVFPTVAKNTYTFDVQLAAVPPPSGTITGRITNASGGGLFGYVYFFKQNADGTWPSGYLWNVTTGSDGRYSSGPLPLGTYKVRLFGSMLGVQWYQYAGTSETATPVVLDTDGQVLTGIDAQFPPPTP